MKKIKNVMKNLVTNIKAFYSTNRTQKLIVSAVVTTVIAGGVVFALLSTSINSPLTADASYGATVSKDAEKDKIAEDKEKPSDEDKKEDTKTDETKKENVNTDASTDTGTTADEGSTTPENKPSTASTSSEPTSNQATPAPAHEHKWEPNMVTIPGQGGVTSDEYILGETKTIGCFTWPDGCEVKLESFTTADVQAEHTAKHGEQKMSYREETVVIEPQVIHKVIKEPVPEHQEQHGWKCSCGATKE